MCTSISKTNLKLCVAIELLHQKACISRQSCLIQLSADSAMTNIMTDIKILQIKFDRHSINVNYHHVQHSFSMGDGCNKSYCTRAATAHSNAIASLLSEKKTWNKKKKKKCNNSVSAGSSITAFEVRALYNCIQHISFSLNDRFQSCYNCIGAARQRDDRAVIGFIVRSPQTVSLRGKQVHPTFVDCIEITGNLKIWEDLVGLEKIVIEIFCLFNSLMFSNIFFFCILCFISNLGQKHFFLTLQRFF